MDPNRSLYLSLFCGQDSRVSQRGSIRTKRKHLRTSGDCLKAIQRLGILQWGKPGHPSSNVLSVRFMKQPREGVWVLLSSSLSWNTAVSALSGHFWPCAYPINKVQEVSHGPRWKPFRSLPHLEALRCEISIPLKASANPVLGSRARPGHPGAACPSGWPKKKNSWVERNLWVTWF